jgi:hypothetical protein
MERMMNGPDATRQTRCSLFSCLLRLNDWFKGKAIEPTLLIHFVYSTIASFNDQVIEFSTRRL